MRLFVGTCGLAPLLTCPLTNPFQILFSWAGAYPLFGQLCLTRLLASTFFSLVYSITAKPQYSPGGKVDKRTKEHADYRESRMKKPSWTGIISLWKLKPTATLAHHILSSLCFVLSYSLVYKETYLKLSSKVSEAVKKSHFSWHFLLITLFFCNHYLIQTSQTPHRKVFVNVCW